MNLSEKIKVDRVICDEIFYIEIDQLNVPIGEIRVPSNAEIDGTVTVTVVSCTPIVDFEKNQLLANVVFLIQKELFVFFFPEGEEPPAGTAAIIPLEFTERIQRQLVFRKCTPGELTDINPDFVDDLRCHIVRVLAEDRVMLTPSTQVKHTNCPPIVLKDASFSQELTIGLKLKLVQERQLVVSLADEQTQAETQAFEVPLLPPLPDEENHLPAKQKDDEAGKKKRHKHGTTPRHRGKLFGSG